MFSSYSRLQNASIPITLGKIAITPEFIKMFVIISLVTTSILGSLVLGLIRHGKERAGIKFIPILIMLSVGLFFLIRFVVGILLGGLFGF